MTKTTAAPQQEQITPQIDPLFLAKLQSSGLDENNATQLSMEFVESCKSIDAQFDAVKGFKIPYFRLDGTPTTFYRIRYLATPSGFASQVAKPQRYTQKANTINEVYCPPLCDWAAIAQNSSIQILITEGELKAACACKAGKPTIALGGVSVWSSAKNNIALLSPLDQFIWNGRSVVIVFDSDAATNPQVAKAQIALAKKITELGAHPLIATLPPSLTGGKQGLDDYIIAGGNLDDVLRETRALELGSRFIELNAKYAYVKDQDTIVELKDGKRIKRDAFNNGLLANIKVIEYAPTASGGVKRLELKVAPEWLQWASRSDVERITYKPGIMESITPQNEYNTWPGWGCSPEPGDLAPWHELLNLLFGEATTDKKWFEQWLAYPLKNPGHKLFTSAVLWGPETGTGKSLIGYTMKEIYGTNFGEIGNQELHSAFNEWSINKQFIMGDEISGTDKRSEADKLKALITQQSLRINMKNMPTYAVPDCINYYFTSNHPDAFFLDDQDRRFFIHRTAAVARREPVFYENYVKWLKDIGSKALFDYFLNLDTSTFNPSAPAPNTTSKAELVDHGRSDLSAWVAYFINNTEIELARLAEFLNVDAKDLDLIHNSHLKWLYDPQNTTRVTPNGLGRELSRAGIKTAAPVQTLAFGVRRFYVIRNSATWLRCAPQKVKEHIDKVWPTAPITVSKY